MQPSTIEISPCHATQKTEHELLIVLSLPQAHYVSRLMLLIRGLRLLNMSSREKWKQSLGNRALHRPCSSVHAAIRMDAALNTSSFVP